MKQKINLKQEIEKFRDCVILVEGKNDVSSLKNVGFEKVHAIHVPGVGLRERIEQIVSKVGTSEVFCVLMDSDKSGKEFYKLIKPILQELGVRVDTKFRGILSRENVSHLEGFEKFIEKVEE
jgi:5S rRNA maturation endonuclease (ribonuclease M5)